MAPGNSTTKLAAWSGWWFGVISRKSSAAGISWSVLTVWWHPTASCASSGKYTVYPQGQQITESEELKTGKICQITEHMSLPASAVVPSTACSSPQILQLISGAGYIFLIWNIIFVTVHKGLLLCADGQRSVQHLWVAAVLPWLVVTLGYSPKAEKMS